jgi:hypothetical protein
MLQLLLKIFVMVSTFTFIVIIALLITAWWLGAFAPLQVNATERGPYYIVTLLEPDIPDHLPAQIDQVRSYLEQRGDHPLLPLGVFYQDPQIVSRRTVEASGGWLIKDSTVVDSPYTLLNIKKQPVALAVTRINRLIAPFKIYPILKGWLERNGYQSAPGRLILELYPTSDSIEVQIPVEQIQYDFKNIH